MRSDGDGFVAAATGRVIELSDVFEDGEPLATYKYAIGLEVWVSKEHDGVNSFRVRAPE